MSNKQRIAQLEKRRDSIGTENEPLVKVIEVFSDGKLWERTTYDKTTDKWITEKFHTSEGEGGKYDNK